MVCANMQINLTKKIIFFKFFAPVLTVQFTTYAPKPRGLVWRR